MQDGQTLILLKDQGFLYEKFAFDHTETKPFTNQPFLGRILVYKYSNPKGVMI